MINVNHYKTLEAAQNHLSFCYYLVSLQAENAASGKSLYGEDSIEYSLKLQALNETQQMISELKVLIKYFDFK